ncbi:MAG: hypothetical protein L6R40_002357 [Gallowayella cf. fulva]|nr:MAG: hypothetical protein L6R40_002357 [Xanthomendoza cf. fulva]
MERPNGSLGPSLYRFPFSPRPWRRHHHHQLHGYSPRPLLHASRHPRRFNRHVRRTRRVRHRCHLGRTPSRQFGYK